MVDEAVHARLAEAREFLAKVDELADVGVGVVVRALLRGGFGAEKVGEQRRVAYFLVCHEVDEGSVFGGEASGFEFCSRKPGEAVMEQV